MENKEPIFPEIKIIQAPAWLRRIGGFFLHLHSEGLSDHSRGAAAMLDRTLYERLGETSDGIQPPA